jgi:tetratricopeptide (TPR) repeat protein
VETCGNNPKAHYVLGLAHDRLGESGAAINAFRKTTELEPDNAKAWFSLGQAYNDNGNRDAAISALTKAGTVDATYAKAWYELGNMFYNSKEFEAALTNYNKATKADDTYYLAWEGLGRTYIEMKDCEAATVALEKGLRDKGNKEIAGAWFYLAAAQNQCGQHDKALASIEQCMSNLDRMGARKKSIRGGAFYEKGLALEAKGDIAGATAAFNEASNEREWRDRAEWELNRMKRK